MRLTKNPVTVDAAQVRPLQATRHEFRVVVCQAAGLETSLQELRVGSSSTRTKSTGGVFMKMPPPALPADCGLDHNVEFTDERIDYLGLYKKHGEQS